MWSRPKSSQRKSNDIFLSHEYVIIIRGDIDLLTVWKNALTQFVFNKSMLNNQHEFALVILTDQANWVSIIYHFII